jgi:radical SAM protein with 4Fe4S-binding SPASM domain
MPFREKKYKDRPLLGVGVDIIGNCNVNCIHCYLDEKPNQLISLDQMKFIIDKTSPVFGEIYLLGGEPTLHPQIEELTFYATKKFHQVILVTNGVKLADAKFCKSLAHHRVSLAMHLRATNKKHASLVDKLAGKPGTFAAQKKAWQNVIRYWPKTASKNVQINLLKPLIEQDCVMEVFRFARRHEFTPIIEMTKASHNYERGDKLDPSIAEIEKLFQQLRQYDKKYYSHKREYLNKIISPPVYNHTCTLVETGIHINTDGTVLPCVGHHGVDIGNIYSTPMIDIALSPILMAIRDYKNWIVGPCKDCDLFDKCHGGCRGEAFYRTGCPRASDPYCFNIPKEVSLKNMVPKSCQGCILKNHPGCEIKI